MPRLSAFLPELAYAVTIHVPLVQLQNAREEHTGHCYQCGVVYWLTSQTDPDNNHTVYKWSPNWIECSKTQNPDSNFDHVCLLLNGSQQPQMWYYDVVGPGGVPFWTYEQPKDAIVVCKDGSVALHYAGDTPKRATPAKRKLLDID
jgi:hypothetical protein